MFHDSYIQFIKWYGVWETKFCISTPVSRPSLNNIDYLLFSFAPPPFPTTFSSYSASSSSSFSSSFSSSSWLVFLPFHQLAQKIDAAQRIRQPRETKAKKFSILPTKQKWYNKSSEERNVKCSPKMKETTPNHALPIQFLSEPNFQFRFASSNGSDNHCHRNFERANFLKLKISCLLLANIILLS